MLSIMNKKKSIKCVTDNILKLIVALHLIYVR